MNELGERMKKYKFEVSLTVLVNVKAKNDLEAIDKAEDAFWDMVDEDHRHLEIVLKAV